MLSRWRTREVDVLLRAVLQWMRFPDLWLSSSFLFFPLPSYPNPFAAMARAIVTMMILHKAHFG